jgi:hypothetical protein
MKQGLDKQSENDQDWVSAENLSLSSIKIIRMNNK